MALICMLSEWDLTDVALLVPKILSWLHFWKICAALDLKTKDKEL
jgi:hypothetical protein